MRFPKRPPSKPPRPSAVTVEDRKKISLLLTREKFDEALKEMRAKISAGAAEQDFSTLYVTAVNGLISQGNMHLEKSERAEAGVAFKKALDYYPSDEAMQRKIYRPDHDIRGIIERLSVDMMDAALLRYRAGAIEEAIDIWDGILSFDPKNAEAMKARETAKTQLRNLKKMK